MPRTAILAGAMRIPVEWVNLGKVKKELTISYQPMGEEPQAIEAFFIDKDRICVPRQYGIELCDKLGIEYEDQTSWGHEAHWPRIPEPRDYQVEYIEDCDAALDNYFDFLARAHTGFGKTISALINAAMKGITTLIVVDQENLRDQWIDALIDPKLFGFKREDIGLIQGKHRTYQGKAVSIAMVQTISQKELPADAYSYFGLVIVDEVHIIGAPTFSTILMLFNAAMRMGVSATPKRRDGLQKLLDFNLGRIRVAADKEHAESSVYFFRNPTIYSWYANISPKTGRFISEVSEDAARNLALVEAAIWLYETGRDVLLIGDRIEHLKHLMSIASFMGVPDSDMGLYAGYNPIFGYERNPTPQRRPVGWDGKTEYTPISLKLISKRIKKVRLAEVKEHAAMLFATYQMFSKGVDVPRLAAGIDVTPRATAEQVHGRILRGEWTDEENATKKRPIWITVADWNSPRAMFNFLSRIKEYLASNARFFEWLDTGGTKEWDAEELRRTVAKRVAELRDLRIETNSDGLNTLRTSNSVSEKRRQADDDIKARFRRKPDGPKDSLRSASSAKSSSATKSRPLRSRRTR